MIFYLCYDYNYFYELLFFLDINECVRGIYMCDKWLGVLICINIIGFYICKCNIGYEGNGYICKGICIELRIFLNVLFIIFILINDFLIFWYDGF